MSAATQLIPECGDQLDDGFDVRAQRNLSRDPRLGVWQRFEDPATAADRSFHNPFVYQEEKNGGFTAQVHACPVTRPAEVVLEMQADVTSGFVNKRADVLVISMVSIMSKTAGPGVDQFTAQ
jgi:hypothetical protein